MKLCGVKVENDRPRQLLDTVVKMQPGIVQHGAGLVTYSHFGQDVLLVCF